MSSKDKEVINDEFNEDPTQKMFVEEDMVDTDGTSHVCVDKENTQEGCLEKQVEELTEELEDVKDKYLRLSAEFDNYRKRTIKEKAELILNGSEKSVVSLLPVIDDLERAVKTSEISNDAEAIKKGIDLIYEKFLSTLAHLGVKKIETEECPLDTDYHEAIATIPAPNEELKGKILDTVQTGYTMNDKVIRHAKVVVGE